MSETQEINRLLREGVAELAPYLFPNGKRDGIHWCVGSIEGEPGKSFKICVAGEKAGLWGDFADTQKHSRSLIDLWMARRNVDFKTALWQASEWLGRSLSDQSNRGAGFCWQTLEEAVAATQRNLGPVTRRDEYHDQQGQTRLVIVRFDDANGKQYRPFHRSSSGWVIKDPPGKLPLFRLPDLVARAAERIYVVEGEKCACELGKLPLLVTTSAHGAKAAEKTDWTPLAGREVVILPDNDQEGCSYAQKVAGILRHLSPPAAVRIINLPNLPPKGDCVEWLETRDAQTPEDIVAELDSLLATNRDTFEQTDDDVSERLNSTKPKVELPGDGRSISAFARDLARILQACGIYQRGGLAVVVNKDGDGLEVITPQMFRTLVEKYVVSFCVRRRNHMTMTLVRTMSADHAQGVLSAPQFLDRLPKVERVTTARLPVMRDGGAIALLPEGYDRESLTLTIQQCEYDETMSLTEARKVIDDLLGEFPFADDGRSKAVAISAMVGIFAAGLLPRGALRPVFFYLANGEGAGKTLLAQCAIMPVHGRVKTSGGPRDEAEIAKELLTAVIEGRSYFLLDNCKGHLASAQLEAFVTSSLWSGRVLGESRSFNAENNVAVFITGNGCTVSPDMRRRSLTVELFMEDERAEDRHFKRVLDETALLAMRSPILAALWALVRAWDAAGRPKPSRKHASFPRWAEITGGIVEFAGYDSPLMTPDIASATDVDGADMRELVELLTDEPVTFDSLVSLSIERGLFERLIGSDGNLKPSDKSRFGKLLTRYDRRIFAGCKRFLVEGKGHSRRFRVVTENGI